MTEPVDPQETNGMSEDEIYEAGGRWVMQFDKPTCAYHIYPVKDWVQHHPEQCVCGPRIELEEDHVGPVFRVTHHSLDGREFSE